MEMNEDNNATASISNLIASLEQATQMAKQLQITSNPSHLVQIYSSLQSTNTHLSSFLSSHNPSPIIPSPASATATTQNLQSDEPMEGAEDDEVEEAEQNPTIERVEERFKDCFIGNKRLKRQLSPASAEQRVYECGGRVEFDPYGTKIRALDLIYQFHS
ncbi:hypothetical protein DCAR_0207800 [Daucus carota subsp. sativus]|uniref:Uncharacterized protein n=1 Tax=Daucus carota subsp. sativus TaxID=79200 RepID=A0A161XGH3_DAUCS|nr:PREDICTED: uncharacterized protein LOC108205969 [Daucus carota subsp. sativus]WOG88565.1 hypothetical protein DCAR_0207800 [Daucus carota subsp. sativus]